MNGAPESGRPADAPLELWTWDGVAWAEVPVTGEWPAWRSFGMVAWDETRRALVVHGGLQSPATQFSDTWEWRNGSWTLAFAGGDAVPSPGFREGAGMAWDPDTGSTVLVAGAGVDGIHSDTWAWDGAAWEQLAPDGAGPSPRFPALLEPDPAGGGLILFGGHVLDGPALAVADTWRWDGTGWVELSVESPPGARVNVAGVVQPDLGRVLLIGGGGGEGSLGDVWAWDGEAWIEIAADAFPPRQGAGAAYDEATGLVLLSGGLDQPGTPARYSDLWAWSGEGEATRLWPDGE